MKRCLDNQINASFIVILRIKWLVFFYCGRLSSAQLVPLQAPKHRPIIGPHPVEQTAFRRDIKGQWIYIRLYKFVAGTSTEYVVDKGIRQKIHKRVNSIIDGSAFCLGANETVSHLDSEKQLRVYMSSHICHTAMSGVLTRAAGKNLKKTECVIRHSLIGGWK